MYINRVELAGFIAKKPERRFLPSGTVVANARLAQTHLYQASNNQQVEHTNWHNLSFYGDLATIALTLEKGDNIFVEGTMEQRQFTPKDGSTRTVNEIVVRHCHLIAPIRGANSTTAAQIQIPNNEGVPDDETLWPVR